MSGVTSGKDRDQDDSLVWLEETTNSWMLPASIAESHFDYMHKADFHMIPFWILQCPVYDPCVDIKLPLV